MLSPILLSRYEVMFRNASNADRAEALRKLGETLAERESPVFKQPEVATLFFEDIAQRLERQ